MKKLPDYYIDTNLFTNLSITFLNYYTKFLCKMNVLNIINMVDFFRFFFISRITEILIKLNF